MASQLVKDLIESGIHFGHKASRWNPKMQPYIFGKRNLIHIINVKETVKGLLLAKKFLNRVVSDGKDVLLVGTKRQARQTIEENAERVSMHCVTNRWLGGMLTNFDEIRKRVDRLQELEQMEADGLLDTYSKKEGSSLRRQMRKIHRNLNGIRNMTRMPGALVVIDQKRELIAVREANKLSIPVICLLDTEADPDLIDIPIPGNDDAMRAIQIIVTQLCDAIAQATAMRAKAVEKPTEAALPRSRRYAMGQAGADRPAEPTQSTAPTEAPAAEPGSAPPATEPTATPPEAPPSAPPAPEAPAPEPPSTPAEPEAEQT